MGPVEITFLVLTPATYFAMLVIERVWPARAFPERSGWQWLGLAFLVLGMAVGNALPLFLPLDWMAEHRWLDGTRLGVIGGTLVGFVVLELGVYAWHRSAHTFAPMWRLFHQIHHAPQRVDIPGSQVFHPLEMAAYTLIVLFVTVIVLGLDPLAAALSGYLLGFASMFQHWNVATPQWIGYVLQRPEAHCVHHRKGVHYYNFSDFTPWDMLFGTFRNPKQYLGECGFEGGADERLGAMLGFADVNASMYGPGSRGVRPIPPAAAGAD
jgi:sterol desaturase/sphingolipid hydroxylase (fatty acid hydroxylase superfamily)